MNSLSRVARERRLEKGAATDLLLLHGKSRKRLNTEPQNADKTGGATGAGRLIPCLTATAECTCESVPRARHRSC